jgi:hypothetical protein
LVEKRLETGSPSTYRQPTRYHTSWQRDGQTACANNPSLKPAVTRRKAGAVTWPTTNEPRSDALQLGHEREQRRRSETLNPGPARGRDTAESTGVTCKRQTNMRQMAEQLRRKTAAGKHQQWHTTAATERRPKKTAPARQKRRAKGRRSRAQRAAQTTPPTGTSLARRPNKWHGSPTLTERPKRPPAPSWLQPAS